MPKLDTGALAKQMLAAAQGSLADKWPQVQDYAEAEFNKLGATCADIGRLYATGQASEGEARVLFEMQKNTARTVMLTVEGMGLLAVEAAINAALDVVRVAVNDTLGFVLV
jgi:hypothetical protein